jgi:hypothetical protein
MMSTFVLCGVLMLAHSFGYAQKRANEESSAQAFKQIVPVLRHPRCMNCHSKGDYPRQGDDRHQHRMKVRRGPLGMGVTAQKCSTCHQDHNLAEAHLSRCAGLASAFTGDADDLGRPH